MLTFKCGLFRKPFLLLQLLLISIWGDAVLLSAKESSYIVTADMRANAVRNLEQHEFVRTQVRQLEARLKPYLNLDRDALWSLPTSQEIGRDSAVNRNPKGLGCPECQAQGKNPGRGYWHVDFHGRPWQVMCNYCQTWYPDNDFQAFYQSALDDSGRFIPQAGDRSLLVPRGTTKRDPVIDDGNGAVVGGETWFFIAYYNFKLWEELVRVVHDFATLYTLTNDCRYAEKALILLNRIADLYPDMDEFPHRQRGMSTSYADGKVIGGGWENSRVQVPLFIAYDYIFDALKDECISRETLDFLARKSGLGSEGSADLLIEHINRNLVLESILAIRSGKTWHPRSTGPYALAAALVALGDEGVTDENVAWLFSDNGGRLSTILNDLTGREGLGSAVGLGYAIIPGRELFQLYELLSTMPDFDAEGFRAAHPKFEAFFTMLQGARVLDEHTTNWGDGSLSTAYGTRTIPLDMALYGYRERPSPERALEVWISNGRTLEGLHGSAYEEDPYHLLDELERDLQIVLDAPFRSHNRGGYGQANLQSPHRENPRAASLYYGRNIHTGIAHGHDDRLTINYFSHGRVLMPDLGYPTYANDNPERAGWTSHIFSHNTAMVNDRGSRRDAQSWSGKTRLFSEEYPVRIVDVDGDASSFLGVSEYRRILVMVDVDEIDSYLVDVFAISGGTNHRLIQNADSVEVVDSSLNFVRQGRGTFAGENVAYGEAFDGPLIHDRRVYAQRGSGFQFLSNVERSQPRQDKWWLTWKIREAENGRGDEGLHLRLWNLTAVDEVALGDGKAPGIPGNPEKFRYSVRSRLGENLVSRFASVLEPYTGEPFIEDVVLMEGPEDEGDFRLMVKIQLRDGREDLIVLRSEMGHLQDDVNGRLLFERQQPDGTKSTLVTGYESKANAPKGYYTGKLEDFFSDDGETFLILTDEVGPEVKGSYIIFENKGRSDASFRIEEVITPSIVSIGRVSLVEKNNPNPDVLSPFIYAVEPGDRYKVYLTQVITK